MSTFADRLNQAMQVRCMKAADLSTASGVDKGLLSHYIRGRYMAKQDKVYALAKALDVSESWLMGKDVPMDRMESPIPTNGDLMDLREQLRRQPGMRILFDASKNATEQDLLDAAALIEGFKRRRGGEE